MKICILGATFKTGNMGVSMLAAGAIRCVARRFPQAQIILCDYAHEGNSFTVSHDGQVIPVQFLNIRFSRKLLLGNNVALLMILAALYRLFPVNMVRQRIIAWNKYFKELLEADLIVSIAYGDSFSDVYGMGRLVYVVLPQVVVLLAGKRLVALPQTYGPFTHPIGKAIAKRILRRTELIYSRDHVGLKTVSGLLGVGDHNHKLKFCYDLAFDVDPTCPATLDIEGLPAVRDPITPLVGFNISGLLMAGGYTRNNMFGLGVSYESLVYKMLEFLMDQKAAHVLLIPHVFASSNDVESDPRACNAVFERLRTRYEGRIGVVRGPYKYDEIKYVIGQCEFFVGARMHACIAAISQCIPTLPVAYSDKFAGVMQAIGFDDCVVDPRRMEIDQMLQRLDKVYERRASVRSEIANRMPTVRQTIRNVLRELDVVDMATDREMRS